MRILRIRFPNTERNTSGHTDKLSSEESVLSIYHSIPEAHTTTGPTILHDLSFLKELSIEMDLAFDDMYG